MDLYEFAEIYNCDWEEMRKHIRVDYDYLDDGEREKEFEHARKECEEHQEIRQSLYEEGYAK